MGVRTAARLAWSLCVLSLILTALSLLFLGVSWSLPDVYVFNYWVENTLVAMVFSTIGAVVASRRPDHPMGWLFCVAGLVGAVRHLAAEYAIYALLVEPGAFPGGGAAAWFSSWLWVPHVGLMVFLGLLFPHGRLAGSRWQLFAWFVVVAVCVGTVAMAFSPGPLSGFGPIENPFGIEVAGRYAIQAHALVWALALVTAASLLVRLHYATGVERQQLKWFAYVVTVAAIGGALAYLGTPNAAGVLWVWWIGVVLVTAGFLSLPIVMGIAILKYRLYDIDLIINRTLVYGTLTVALALVYFVSVILLEYVFRALTGVDSQIVVVVSTLAIAALFQPLRRNIQDFIDRRFYRRKYDAQEMLGEFSRKLRDETDLGALSSDLLVAVRQTIQPEHTSLWLRPPAGKGRERIRR
jgi:hypothetical protein